MWGETAQAAHPLESPQEGMQRWYELQIRPSPPDLGTQCRPPCTSAQCQPGIWGRQASTVGTRAVINHHCLRLSERTPRWYRVWLQEMHTSQPTGTHTHRESASSFRALALVMSASSLTASSFTRPARMLGSGGHCRHEYLQWVNEQPFVLQTLTASDTYLWGASSAAAATTLGIRDSNLPARQRPALCGIRHLHMHSPARHA